MKRSHWKQMISLAAAFHSKGFKWNNENGEFLMLLTAEINTST